MFFEGFFGGFLEDFSENFRGFFFEDFLLLYAWTNWSIFKAVRIGVQPSILFFNGIFVILHWNPLQDIYRVELLHREIPVVITGNGLAVYNFFLFWLHSFPV
jgi:hypothetical protein